MPSKKTTPKFGQDRYKHIDIIVSSGRIRREFFSRCKLMELNSVTVAMKAGLSIRAFNEEYLNNTEPVACSKLPQDKFIKMLELVGIEIKVQVILKPLDKNIVEH